MLNKKIHDFYPNQGPNCLKNASLSRGPKIDNAALVGRLALVLAMVLSPDRRDPQDCKMLAVLLFKSRLQQVPVFHPNDSWPEI